MEDLALNPFLFKTAEPINPKICMIDYLPEFLECAENVSILRSVEQSHKSIIMHALASLVYFIQVSQGHERIQLVE
jgi:hypothetical protein